MTAQSGPSPSFLPPDEAFAVLGNETRMEILQALGDANEPVPFSELRGRVGLADSGQFNYHLNRLVGHFVQQEEEGYSLYRAGERVIEAVLSGAVTETPVLEPIEIDDRCPFCESDVRLSFTQERVEFYCTSCAGSFGPSSAQESFEIEDYGFLGRLSLPPAGLNGRTPSEIVDVAWIWGELEFMAMSRGVCPRCAASVDRTVTACGSHDAAKGLCENCGRRHAANVQVECSNCILEVGGLITVCLAGETEFLHFLISHGIDPLSNQEWITTEYDEEIHSVDPFQGEFTFSADGDRMSLRLDEDLSVTVIDSG